MSNQLDGATVPLFIVFVLVSTCHLPALFDSSSLLCFLFFCSSPEKFSVSEIRRGGLLPPWIISCGDRGWAGRYKRVRKGALWKSQIAYSKGRGGDIRGS